jgi:hypothetical protein
MAIATAVHLGRAALVLLVAALGSARPCAGEETPRPPAKEPSALAAPARKPALRGAAPGDERGPGRFVARTDRTFYAAAGGRLWYYLNLHYWVPEDLGGADLWIRAEVVAAFRDLQRWPDSASVEAPPRKTTVEYWKVGPSGRTVVIDNHKDFWSVHDDWCAGAVGVEITLQLGRVLVRDARGAWAKPTLSYVLDRKSYEPRSGIGAENIAFSPLPREPVNVWRYDLAWSTCPARFLRSNWAEMRTPELRLVSSVVPAGPTVVTGGR